LSALEEWVRENKNSIEGLEFNNEQPGAIALGCFISYGLATNL